MTRPISQTTDSIPRLILRIGIPSSIGMLFNTMYNSIDTWCAGLLGTNALAAISLSFPLFFVMFAVGNGLAQGTVALLANALGAGRPDDARRVFAQSVTLSAAAGIALSITGLLCAPWLFRKLGATGDYYRAAVVYMDIMLAGGLFFIVPMTLNTALSAVGETRVYRNLLIGGCIANGALNPVLMWGWLGLPALGVAGIALATLLIQLGGGIWLWSHVARGELGRALEPRMFVPDAATVRRIAGQAMPATLNMLTIALGIFVFTWFTQRFGRDAVAASGIATRIEQAVLMPVIGLATAVLGITGQNHGAGLPHRVRETWLTSIAIGVALMLPGGLLLWALRHAAMRIFTNDPAVIALGGGYLGVACWTLAAYPILFATVFLMQGLKRPAYGLWIGLYRQALAPLLVAPALAFGLGWGLRGIWWGVCMVNWSAALFALWWGWRAVRTGKACAKFAAGRAGACPLAGQTL